MGKAMHGRFQGTAGSSASSNTLNDNIPNLTKKYPLKNGYFGTPASKKDNYVRHIASKDPLGTAKEFYKLATKNYETETLIPGGKGKYARMRDGTEITIRPVSSSPDKSPAVDINIASPGQVNKQKIHFIKDTNHD